MFGLTMVDVRLRYYRTCTLLRQSLESVMTAKTSTEDFLLGIVVACRDSQSILEPTPYDAQYPCVQFERYRNFLIQNGYKNVCPPSRPQYPPKGFVRAEYYMDREAARCGDWIYYKDIQLNPNGALDLNRVKNAMGLDPSTYAIVDTHDQIISMRGEESISPVLVHILTDASDNSVPLRFTESPSNLSIAKRYLRHLILVTMCFFHVVLAMYTSRKIYSHAYQFPVPLPSWCVRVYERLKAWKFSAKEFNSPPEVLPQPDLTAKSTSWKSNSGRSGAKSNGKGKSKAIVQPEAIIYDEDYYGMSSGRRGTGWEYYNNN